MLKQNYNMQVANKIVDEVFTIARIVLLKQYEDEKMARKKILESLKHYLDNEKVRLSTSPKITCNHTL
jgi:hypothetical protein